MDVTIARFTVCDPRNQLPDALSSHNCMGMVSLTMVLVVPQDNGAKNLHVDVQTVEVILKVTCMCGMSDLHCHLITLADCRLLL